MPIEIERKFLVLPGLWHPTNDGLRCRQGYLAIGPPASVRVRVMGGRAMLNMKQSTLTIARAEFEYPIPLDDAHTILDTLCAGRVLEKTRHHVKHAGHLWEVDVFHGANDGLVVAEIELSSEDEVFERPPWLGAEVSGNARYLNSSLTLTPFSTW